MEYLVWKSKLSSEGYSTQQDILNPEPTGKPTEILAAIRESHPVTMEDAEALMQSIREGEIPMRFDTIFDKSTGNN